jgi:hypothetical protein
MADVSVRSSAGPRGPRLNAASDREITLNGSEHAADVQHKTLSPAAYGPWPGSTRLDTNAGVGGGVLKEACR